MNELAWHNQIPWHATLQRRVQRRDGLSNLVSIFRSRNISSCFLWSRMSLLHFASSLLLRRRVLCAVNQRSDSARPVSYLLCHILARHGIHCIASSIIELKYQKRVSHPQNAYTDLHMSRLKRLEDSIPDSSCFTVISLQSPST